MLSSASIPPPESEDDFETLVLDVFRRFWNDRNAQRNGRRSQRQDGIDIFGQPDRGSDWAGIRARLSGAPRAPVSEDELLQEVEKAKAFQPPLRWYYLVTSAPADKGLQEAARFITAEHRRVGLFSVYVWGWDDLAGEIAKHPDLARLYSPASSQASAAKEERDRPRFALVDKAVMRLEAQFTPQFVMKQVSGDAISAIEWRFRGPRFAMDWRTVDASGLERTTFSQRFDLTAEPHHDDRVALNEVGLEFRFQWRGKWRHELHRWPVARDESPQKAMWDIGDEIIPPLYFDYSDT